MRGDRGEQAGSSAGVGISHGSGRARGVLTQQGIHLQKKEGEGIELPPSLAAIEVSHSSEITGGLRSVLSSGWL